MAYEHEDDGSLLGDIEARVHNRADEASTHLDDRDPEFIESAMPAIEFAMRWFDPEVRGMDRLPADGPFLIVGNHSGGIFMPDYYAFLREWVRTRGAESPLYSLGFDLIFSIPGGGSQRATDGDGAGSPRDSRPAPRPGQAGAGLPRR